ncbi:hypothetical protein RHS03_05788, partial [Rhizoctonia solani]
MPASTIMHGGELPLDALFSFKSKSRSQASPPPEFTQAFLLDSTRLLSGLFGSYGNVEYAIATSGEKTVISRPSRSTNVGIIHWKEGWVETEGLKIIRNEWIDQSKWSASQTHVFQKWGRNPEIKWSTRNGEWEATNSKGEVLAAFVVRRGALGTRIGLTDIGRPYTDALVLTGIITATGEEEWRWHTFLQARRDAVEATSTPGPEPGATADTPNQPTEETLPTYREAPFTRPLGPLLTPSSIPAHMDSRPDIPTDRPLKLTLASRHPLNGIWYEEDQPIVNVRTIGPRTIIGVFVHNTSDTEPTVKVASTINWAEGKVTVVGSNIDMNTMFNKIKNSIFSKTNKCAPDYALKETQLISKIYRKSQVCTLHTLTSHWTATPQTSPASIYPDPNAHIRYECRTAPPQNHPLALLIHYLKRKGTTIELTPEGHNVLVEIFTAVLVLIYGTTGEWKKLTGVGTNVSGEGPELVLGEEMVSDLDGWAGPVELMRLRQQGGEQS